MEKVGFSEEERYNTPMLNMKQLFAAQELGNLIQLWADDPASVDESRLERIQELGRLFNIDLASALWEAQRKVREEFNNIAEQAFQQMSSILVPHGAPLRHNGPQMVGSFFNNDLPRRKPQSPPPYPSGNPSEPFQDSGVGDAQRAQLQAEQELTALRVLRAGRSLSGAEIDRYLELAEILGVQDDLTAEVHSLDSGWKAAPPSEPAHELITHKSDYNPGTLVGVPSDIVNGSTDTAHLPAVLENDRQD